ncbi:MAG: RnfABCDGE type electron transport complex subunit E [Gammaproteobacteria bacterium]|nr:RnfABCDGE type electron transport complex subunit E [Gammaproteobacteria bacterium]
MSQYGEIIQNGLWKNNPAMVQVLGLCPLLAVTSTVVNSLGLGVATTLVLIITNVTISLIRNFVRPEIRMPVFVMVIAVAVTIAQLIIEAYFYELYLIIGLFIALITTNCVIMARAEAFASKNNVGKAFLDGLFMGLGSTLVLVTLGAMRELIGYGTLFRQFNLLFGDAAASMKIIVFHDYPGFLLAILPPGAFIGLGLLIAVKNIIDARRAAAQTLVAPQTAS